MPSVVNSCRSSIYGETQLSSGSTWTQLTATSQVCQRVLLSAPTPLNNIAKNNSGNVLVKLGTNVAVFGAPPSYNAPSGAMSLMGGWTLQPGQNGIQYELCSDPAQIFIYGTIGDAVEWEAQL